MKIYPDISRLWGKRIREAGMTKNQAKKVLDENDKTQKEAQKFVENTPPKSENKSSVGNILKKLNIF